MKMSSGRGVNRSHRWLSSWTCRRRRVAGSTGAIPRAQDRRRVPARKMSTPSTATAAAGIRTSHVAAPCASCWIGAPIRPSPTGRARPPSSSPPGPPARAAAARQERAASSTRSSQCSWTRRPRTSRRASGDSQPPPRGPSIPASMRHGRADLGRSRNLRGSYRTVSMPARMRSMPARNCSRSSCSGSCAATWCTNGYSAGSSCVHRAATVARKADPIRLARRGGGRPRRSARRGRGCSSGARTRSRTARVRERRAPGAARRCLRRSAASRTATAHAESWAPTQGCASIASNTPRAMARIASRRLRVARPRRS